jgi:uncharacterized membrane protein YgcG
MKLRSIVCGLIAGLVPLVHVNAQGTVVPVTTPVAAAELINQLHHRSWVRLDKSGAVQGRVLVIESSDRIAGRIDNKVILSRDGKAVYETRTGSDGQFEIKGLPPGSYAIQTVGEYTYAAMAIHILPAANQSRLESSFDVFATTIGDKARQFLTSAMVPSDLEVGQDVYYRSFDKDPLGDARQFSKSHQVTLEAGNLIGRISRPGWGVSEQDLSDSVVRIFRAGEVVATAQVEKNGAYMVEGLTPGIYDFLVAGGDGFAAFRFEAVQSSDSQVNNSAGSVKFVVKQSAQDPAANGALNIELISQPEVMTVNQNDDEEVVYYEDFGYAGGGGGGFGGGGGGLGGGGGGGIGGGGGLAGLAGIAGLAVGVSALASSDDPVASTPSGP